MKLELRKLLQMLGVLQPDPVFYIGGSDVLPQPLAPAQEQALLRELAAGSESAKQTLIERNLRLVVYLARRFENTGIGMEDLISIGTIGLIKAVSTFRVDRNIKLATYASRCIENEILMYIRKISGQKAEVSLDEPINTDWDGNELLLSDVLGTESETVMRPMEDDVDHELLRQALSRLSEREMQIVQMRFGLGGRPEKTQKEVAELMGHLTIVHFQAGKADYAASAPRNFPSAVRVIWAIFPVACWQKLCYYYNDSFIDIFYRYLTGKTACTTGVTHSIWKKKFRERR